MICKLLVLMLFGTLIHTDLRLICKLRITANQSHATSKKHCKTRAKITTDHCKSRLRKDIEKRTLADVYYCCLLPLLLLLRNLFKSLPKWTRNSAATQRNSAATQAQLSATQLQLSRVANHAFQALELHISGSELQPATHCNSEPLNLQKTL